MQMDLSDLTVAAATRAPQSHRSAGLRETTAVARTVFQEQAQALNALATNIGDEFARAVEIIRSIKGRVVISGMGKSGIIGRKIAATLASTGTPSFFVHPGEAYHGDLGMITPDDLALLLSYSGETDEVIKLIPFLKHFSIPIVSICGRAESKLARNSDVFLGIGVSRETCPINLAPTTSTTATLVMGDAIAVALMRLKNFQPHQFAVFHPGGSLGRRLLTRVRDVMHCDFPTSEVSDNIRSVIDAITRGQLGITVVMEDGNLRGVITDGDLRRALYASDDFRHLTASEIMTPTPLRIAPETMFAEAEQIMTTAKVSALLVMQPHEAKVMGIVKIFDAP